MKEKTTEPRYFFCRDFNGVAEILYGDYPNRGWQQIHSGTGNLEESKKIWNLIEKPCVECGQMFVVNYCEPYKTILIRDNICFSCNHWRDMLNHCGSPNQVIVKGGHYLICKDDGGDSRFKGHAGALFKIKFKDGREVQSNNVWFQGTIPSHFSERLPDNAEFQSIT